MISEFSDEVQLGIVIIAVMDILCLGLGVILNGLCNAAVIPAEAADIAFLVGVVSVLVEGIVIFIVGCVWMAKGRPK